MKAKRTSANEYVSIGSLNKISVHLRRARTSVTYRCHWDSSNFSLDTRALFSELILELYDDK